MTLELTFGRTTFSIRREAAKPSANVVNCPDKGNSFAANWTQIFNGTWEVKAGASFPKQFAKQWALKQRITEGAEIKDEQE